MRRRNWWGASLGAYSSQRMPAIYQGQCFACGYKSPMTSGGHSAIIVDDLSTVAMHDTYPDRDDKRIVILAHPGENLILREYGLTYTSAVLAGRFLLIGEHFCESCGHLYKSRELGSCSLVFGCLPPALIGLIGAAIIGFQAPSVVDIKLLGFLATLFSWLLIDRLVGIYVRSRYAARAREFRIHPVCPKCGSHRVATAGTFPCPKCHSRSMKIEVVGVS